MVIALHMPVLPGGFSDPEELNSLVLSLVPKKRTRQSHEVVPVLSTA